jgi:hypothetical protein
MRGVVLLAQATGDEPAGGAAAAAAIGATVGVLVVTAVIALVIAGHRSGRIRSLARLAAFAERQSGLPGWAALPSAFMGISCSRLRSACTWTSRSTSTTGATTGRSPTPPTT